ncbi:cysteine hydrolase family protein [Limnochorda pilosa]|uniref:Isochorismatase n=1 Tax=Limnochorda pilosa TaxID=1555112 RepID=A0A0K2SI98_LIMPI|nr:isochorismatase family cysteine hydrolase [Limnochorda pilosa]BAS26569.1 isochorismatase [Limnochorda pilosa]
MELQVPEYPVTEAVELNAASTALIVVDMQRDFAEPGGRLFVPDAPGTVPVIRDLLERARRAGAFRVFTQDSHGAQDPEFDIWGEHAVEGTPGWEIVEPLRPQPGEYVVRKLRYDAFYGTSLEHQLRVHGVETVIVCGTVANICVHYTAASAALRWFRVVLPVDAVSALDPFDLQSSIRQTAFLFQGTITRAAGIRFATPGGPAA